MINLAYAGELEFNNTKGLLFTATFVGNYGVNGAGDLLNLAPYELSSNPGGITDPALAYNNIIAQPPSKVGVFSESLGGSYVQPKKAAVPSLTNWGLQMYEPGGTEKATNAAYTAAELAGSVTLLILLPLQ